MSNFTKADITTALRESSAATLSKSTVDEIVTGIFQIIKDAAEAGNTVSIAGFGRFAIKERAARLGRNPATGEALAIAASRSLGFKASKSKT